MKKTRVWSSDGAARAELRAFEVSLAPYARNLGAHQNFTRHCWNSVLQDRLKTMHHVWPLLRASLSPYAHKVHALQILAWPRALHGIAVVHLGLHHFKTLRSGAMRGLKADRKGANPVLHLATANILADPEAWAIAQTLRDARELGGYDRMEAILGLFATTADGLPRNGPTAVLVDRLSRIGWICGSHGLVQDRLGSFCLWTVPWDELCVRLRLAWSHVLEVTAGSRQSFAGLHEVDIVATQKALGHYSSADQVYLRCHLDGTLFVANARAKFQPGTDDRCEWCGNRDGFEHRAWHCPYFECCRTHLSSAQRQEALSLPPAFSVHGWALVLAEWELYVDFLLRDDCFRKMSPVNLPPLRASNWCDLFVDGTCANPTEPCLRYGSWAVTLAAGGPGSLTNQVVLAGHLQGLCQSAFRAELAAVYNALVWATERCQKVRLWCDCLGVVQRVRRLLKGGRVSPNRAHSDLWRNIAELLRTTDLEVQIIKVVSHCCVTAATNAEEEWVYWHNRLTDQAAAVIKDKRSPEFWTAWKNLAAALTSRRCLHQAILLMLLKQSRLANVNKPIDVSKQPRVNPGPAVVMPAAPREWILPEKLFRRYGQSNVEAIHRWWSACGKEVLSGRGELRLVAGLQLFFDFRWATEHIGPFLHRKRWFAEEANLPPGCVVNWSDRTKAFLLLWKSYLRCNDVDVPHKMSKPHGLAFGKWVVSYYLRWPDCKFQAVDDHIFRQLGRQVTSQRDISSLTPNR